MKVKHVSYKDIVKWRAAAAKEHVSLQESIGAHWFTVDGVGCGAVAISRIGPIARGRIKGIWLDPAFRGQGLGTEFTSWLIDWAWTQECKTLDVFAVNERFYLARGWQLVGRNAHGYAHLTITRPAQFQKVAANR